MTESDDAADIEPYASALADALVAAIPAWMDRAITSRAPGVTADAVSAAASAAVADVETDLRSLLAADIDEQDTTPLAIARRVVKHAAPVLVDAGAPAPPRDEHARSLHPDDVYDLTPGGFVDFGDEAQAAGIAWGAAKAHIHMRRHAPPTSTQASTQTSAPTDAPSEESTPAISDASGPIGAVVPNIMDRSRFGPDVVFFDEAGFSEEAAFSDEAGFSDGPGSDDDSAPTRPTDLRLLIVDLDRVGELAPFVSDRFPTIGFGSHVDEERLAEAERAGMAAAMARSIFFKRLPDILRPTADGPAS